MLVFATLGPSGSNHELVTRRYLEFHGLGDARVELVLKFEDALEMMLAGSAQHIVQVAVHPETSETVARYYFRHRIYVIDAFIAPSHPLGVLTRADVTQPKTLALQPATRGYIDTSRWPTLIPEVSIASVAEGLLAGRYDSGLTALHFAESHPGRFRVDCSIGTIDDPWLVYGTQRTSGGNLLAWPNSPAAQLY
ncbi:MAG: hypothetical protein H7Z43_09750, partial [Clostridia bacterium]|nr:hypothetical protein [Deltaproteobacteria bacterium]